MLPRLHVAVAPTQPVSIPSLFRSDDVRRVLEHPPVTREEGFNVLTYERAEIVEGDRLVIDAWRKRLELFRDGTFVAGATFADFLGLPRDTAEFAENPKINSLGLIEFTHDVFRTYEAILDYVEPLPAGLRCQVGIRDAHFDDQKLWMAPYALGATGFEFPINRNEAPAASVTRETEVEAQPEKPHINPGRITFALVEQLYNWFGLESTSIPYLSLEAEEVDPQMFSARR
jgi:hypothetical protein